MSRLELVPITLREACAFVAEHHRHSNPPRGHKLSLAATAGGGVVGVVILGRPIARHLDDGWTLEALRVCTDGTRNACSFLYGAAWRAARALGYRRLVTYTLASESGSSLRASGFRVVGQVDPRSWSCPSRPRVDRHELQGRFRWEISA